MTIGTQAVATAAVGETRQPAGVICDLEPSRFSLLAKNAADVVYRNLGERACYTPAGGSGAKYITVIMDQDIQDLDNLAAEVSETRYAIAFRKTEVEQPRRGDQITVIDGQYRVETIRRNDDREEWTVSARRING